MLSDLEPDVNERPPEGEIAHKIWQWAIDNNLSMLNLAIQFCLRQPLIATNLSGSKNTTEVEQNFVAATTLIADEVWEEYNNRFTDEI